VIKGTEKQTFLQNGIGHVRLESFAGLIAATQILNHCGGKSSGKSHIQSPDG
jgi:hypothetical protein